MATWIQKIFPKRGKTMEEQIEEEKKKNEFDGNSAYSILLKKIDRHELISKEEGILIMCTHGVRHAFLMMEYLEEKKNSNKYIRSFLRLDFRPKSMHPACILLGEAKLDVTRVVNETEEETEKFTKSIGVGPYWKVDVEKVKATFNAVVGAHSENKAPFTNEELQVLYSLPGESSGSSMPKSTDTNNCVSYSREFMGKYYERLGLTKGNVDFLGNDKFVLVQSPWPLVHCYKIKQRRNILL